MIPQQVRGLGISDMGTRRWDPHDCSSQTSWGCWSRALIQILTTGPSIRAYKSFLGWSTRGIALYPPTLHPPEEGLFGCARIGTRNHSSKLSIYLLKIPIPTENSRAAGPQSPCAFLRTACTSSSE